MGIMHTLFVISEKNSYGARFSLRCPSLHDLGLCVPGAGGPAGVFAGTDGRRALRQFRSGGGTAGLDGAA